VPEQSAAVYVQFGYLRSSLVVWIHDIEPIGYRHIDGALVPYFGKGQSSAELQVPTKGNPVSGLLSRGLRVRVPT